MTKRFNVKVVVEYEYEVDVENEELAEKEGWNYEDYANWASVYSVEVEDITPEDWDEEEEDEEDE